MATIQEFAARLEAEQRAGLIARGYDPAIHRHAVRLKVGRKYCNVDVGGSGKYMVENATGQIFGIKGYGVIHRGHAFGTLATVDQWDWSGYAATPKAAATGGPRHEVHF